MPAEIFQEPPAPLCHHSVLTSHNWQHCLAISWRVSVGVASIGAPPFLAWHLVIQIETATSGIALLWAALLFVPLLVEVPQQDVGLFSYDHLIRWVVTSGKVHRWPSHSGSAGWVRLEAGEVVLVVRRQALQELCSRHFYGMTVNDSESIGFQMDKHHRRFDAGKFGPRGWHCWGGQHFALAQGATDAEVRFTGCFNQLCSIRRN